MSLHQRSGPEYILQDPVEHLAPFAEIMPRVVGSLLALPMPLSDHRKHRTDQDWLDELHELQQVAPPIKLLKLMPHPLANANNRRTVGQILGRFKSVAGDEQEKLRRIHVQAAKIGR